MKSFRFFHVPTWRDIWFYSELFSWSTARFNLEIIMLLCRTDVMYFGAPFIVSYPLINVAWYEYDRLMGGWWMVDNYGAWLYVDVITYLFRNRLRPRQNGSHFPDDILNGFSWTKMYKLIIHWSLINNFPALVPLMTWRRPGDMSLPEPMMVSLLTHICVTRPQGIWCSHVLVNLFQ